MTYRLMKVSVKVSLLLQMTLQVFNSITALYYKDIVINIELEEQILWALVSFLKYLLIFQEAYQILLLDHLKIQYLKPIDKQYSLSMTRLTKRVMVELQYLITISTQTMALMVNSMDQQLTIRVQILGIRLDFNSYLGQYTE